MTKPELLEIAARLAKFASEMQGSDYVEFPDGGLGCRVEHWGVKHLAKSLMDSFKDGGDPPNYLIMVVGHPEGQQVEVTLRPLDRERRTPAMDVADLKKRVAELENRNLDLQLEVNAGELDRLVKDELMKRVQELEAELAGASQLLDEQEAKRQKRCRHLFRPLQNFSCAVIGRKCVRCDYEEISDWERYCVTDVPDVHYSATLEDS